jgi:YD repeat-containing protein
MFRKIYAPESLGIFLLACIGFSVGFVISYRWVQSPKFIQSALSIPTLGSDKETDGLRGPVNRVKTETAKLYLKSGELVEGQRELLESTTYDRQGKRVDNSYYLVASNSQIGREEYAYDEKGNVSEMTARDGNNNILSKEVYAYEYDAVGNWVKMITSTVVYEGGKVTPQPVEVTYRNITYYYDQAIAEIVKSNSPPVDNLSEEERAQGDFTSLHGALGGWIAASNARDLETLMKFYAPKLDFFYRARNVSQDFVRADKAGWFERVEEMQLSVGTPEITISDDAGTATMRFRKEYTVKIKGREQRGQVIQLLQWQRTSEGWKIMGERDIKILRRS